MFTFTDNEQIIKEVKKLFIENNIKQADLCEKMNIRPQRLQQIYKKQGLTFTDIDSLLKAIGYDMKIDFVPTEK